MKILYVVSTLSRCGPTNQLLNLVRESSINSMHISIVTLSPEPEDSLFECFRGLGVSIKQLELSRIKGLLFIRSMLKTILGEIQPDIIHTQGMRADFYIASITRKSAKHLCTIRNFPQLDYRMTYSAITSALMLIAHTFALKRADLCVGVSQAVSKNLVNHFSLNNVATVLNGVDTERYRPIAMNDKVGLRRELGIPTDRTVWVCSGHLADRKNPLFLIEAFKRGSFSDDSVLLFIGSGELFDECVEASKENPNIIIKGRVTRVSDYLSASDFYISSSLAEGMPNAALEALASGIPVVLSDIPPHRELVGMAEKIGALFDLSSFHSLQKAISCTVDLDSSSKQAISGVVETSLSAKAMAGKYNDLYTKLVKSNEQ